jgi:DNA-binding NarL/FixJ family response regulator
MSSTLERARAALAKADWVAAKDAFEEALQAGDGPEARDGLGYVLWWLDDPGGSLRECERAYVAYVDSGERQSAARVALFISNMHRTSFGNVAAGQGWEARAERLVADLAPCTERVVIEIRRAKRLTDPTEAAAKFEEARAIARSIGDRDLDILLLSAHGRALVALGRLDEGFVLLDEAMARTTAGEVANHWWIAETCYNMLIACERAHDLPRAAEWCRVAEDWARRAHHLPFFAFCRITYGGVLFARGRWAEAEDAFVDAMRRYETAHPAAAALAVGRLAELRVAQGQVEDASAMLVPWYDHPACAHAAAALETAHGELDVAASRLERRIAIVERDPSLLAPLCETLAGVHLARGDRAGARENGVRLKAIADRQQSRMLTAMADATLGAIAVESNTPEAITRLSRALDAYVELAMPYRAGRTQLALARALAGTRRDAAAAGARAALATFEQLGAAPCAEAAAELLGSLAGTRPTIKRRIGFEALTKREAQVLELLGEGLSNPLIAERLDISAKTAEHHVCSILAKLDVKSRAAAAVWLARREKKALP